MKRNIVFSSLMVLVIIFGLLTATSCQKKSYGDVLDSKAKLLEKMEADNLDFKYPEYMGTDGDNAEYQHVAVKTADDKAYSGYKIYCFGSPFYTSVTAYNTESDKLLSDEEERTPFLRTVRSSVGEIKVYSGKGHKDALYLIGCINMDSKHYEVRITADEEMQDGKYVHAIYEDNEFYIQAFDVMTGVLESLK